MKDRKLYCYTTSMVTGALVLALIAGLTVLVILFFRSAWYLLIAVVLLAAAFVYMLRTGIFFPIHCNAIAVRYRGRTYAWKDIRITAVSVPDRGIIASYFLMFDENYVFGKEQIVKIKKSGFYVYLKMRPLREILRFYTHEIEVVDQYGEESPLRSSAKLNRLIAAHNAKVRQETDRHAARHMPSTAARRMTVSAA